VFKATADPDLSLVSRAELDTIELIVSRLGHLTGPQLSKLAHNHATWLTNKPEENEPPKRIEYELFFKEDFESCRHARAALLLEQEERDFARGV
jgi:hypothetical protein